MKIFCLIDHIILPSVAIILLPPVEFSRSQFSNVFSTNFSTFLIKALKSA
ncbi:hypothetical protein [Rickettsia tamurae]|nr:hypothetical protein [Rickettsia tamurae]